MNYIFKDASGIAMVAFFVKEYEKGDTFVGEGVFMRLRTVDSYLRDQKPLSPYSSLYDRNTVLKELRNETQEK